MTTGRDPGGPLMDGQQPGAPKFSPGPWSLCPAHGGSCQCGLVWSKRLDFSVASVDRENESGEITDEQFQSNKRLISRAPSMYQALRRCRAIIIDAARMLHVEDGHGGEFEACEEDCSDIRDEATHIARLLDLSGFEVPV
jgi:hypothetical protein